MPTLHDIAIIAGVSKATVSLALSDHSRISSETKAKIRQIAAEIGYIREKKSPITASSPVQTIGVLYLGSDLDLERNFFKDTLMGICQEAARQDIKVIILGIHLSAEENTSEDIYNQVMSSKVSGVIVISHHPQLKELNMLITHQFPIVLIGDRKIVELDYQPYSVASDNYGGGKTATDYLIRLGHKRIAIAINPHSPPWVMERINGYYSALRQADLPFDPEMLVTLPTGAFNRQDPCWNKLRKLKPTAIFATSAHIGMAITHYLRTEDLQVPTDVSQIVFDDSPSFPHENPPITIVRQDLKSLGIFSARLLWDLLNKDENVPKQLLLSTQLIIRDSCSAPARQG